MYLTPEAMTAIEPVDVQAKAASELDVMGVKECDYFLARELVGLTRKRCGICGPCERFQKFLAHVGFLRWSYQRTPMATDGEQ